MSREKMHIHGRSKLIFTMFKCQETFQIWLKYIISFFFNVFFMALDLFVDCTISVENFEVFLHWIHCSKYLVKDESLISKKTFRALLGSRVQISIFIIRRWRVEIWTQWVSSPRDKFWEYLIFYDQTNVYEGGLKKFRPQWQHSSTKSV